SRPERPGMRTSEIIMLKPPARRVSRACSPDATVTVSKPWLRRKESSRLRCPGSSSTIRMRGPLAPFLRASEAIDSDPGDRKLPDEPNVKGQFGKGQDASVSGGCGAHG